MPDLPDDYPFLPGSTRSPLVDLGEMAARLGSPVVYDRRGEVLFADDFQHGLSPYTTTALGTGAEVTLESDAVDAGPYSAALTGGSDGAREASLYRWQAPLAAAKYGLEVSFWLPSGGYESIELVLQFYDGSTLQTGRFRHSSASGWAYLRSNGTYKQTSIPSLFGFSDPMFYWAKLVVDFSTFQYVRFLTNDAIFGMVNIDLQQQASALNSAMAIGVIVKSNAGANNSVRLGRFIITANEP